MAYGGGLVNVKANVKVTVKHKSKEQGPSWKIKDSSFHYSQTISLYRPAISFQAVKWQLPLNLPDASTWIWLVTINTSDRNFDKCVAVYCAGLSHT